MLLCNKSSGFHWPILKQNTLDRIIWACALSGPAGIHLQEDIWGKRVVGLQCHLEKQCVFTLQLYGAVVLMGVGVIGVQRHGQPQLLGRGELHQGQGGEPTTKVRGFMYNQAKCSKDQRKRLTTPCPRRLRCYEYNVEGRHTSRWFLNPAGWWFSPCSRRQTVRSGTQCGFCWPRHQ